MRETLFHMGSIPGSERFPAEGNGNPLQYSCLGNPMDRGAWRARVHGVSRVGHDWATKPLPLREFESKAAWNFGKSRRPRCWSWSSNTLATWCWEKLRAWGKGDDRGRDGWMVLLTWWTWIWASSGRWWRTGKPGMLQPMGLQRVRHDWVTEQQGPRYCSSIPQTWYRTLLILSIICISCFTVLVIIIRPISIGTSIQTIGLQRVGHDWGDLAGPSVQNRRRQWHPTPVLLPGKSHGERSLVGCSPWGREESDTTEWLHFHFSL